MMIQKTVEWHREMFTACGHVKKCRLQNNIFRMIFMCCSVKSLSRVRLLVTWWTVARHAPLSMEFSRQVYWSGLPFPSPGDSPTQELNPDLLHCRQILYHLSHQGSPIAFHCNIMQLAWLTEKVMKKGSILYRQWSYIPHSQSTNSPQIPNMSETQSSLVT